MPEIGQTLSHFTIVRKIGVGGMGEVYLADDTTLDRKVALKFLPEAFTSDPERMARFEREAKLLASLNHPNIAGIYGLEQANGNRFLVLEYVEGETLQARLSKGALPLEDALALCRQIAEGLEAAHEKGVIHRDLKPANVMITAEEKVKILDFGLAKALADERQGIDSSQSPTLTEAMTRPGVILGTAAYMSPEQAKGKSVDKRADIWAFGCILYECLTGKRAFEGETITETLAAALTKDPEWDRTPVKTHAALHRCLEKDPKKRLRDIGEALAWIEKGPDTIHMPARVNKPWLAWGAAAIFLLAFAVSFFMYLRATSIDTNELMKLNINPTAIPAVEGSFALSPDGRYLAYAAKGDDNVLRLWLREIDSRVDIPLNGTESSYIPPFFWSHDSRYIAFDSGGTLKKIDVYGNNPPSVICKLPAYAVGGSWNNDDVIILGILGEGVMRVDAGGRLSYVTKPNQSLGETNHLFPVFLRDGRYFLYFCASGAPGKQGIYLGSLDSKPEEQSSELLQISNFRPGYVPSIDSDSGYLLFMQETTLMVQAFDEKRLEPVGEPKGIAKSVGSFMSFGYFSASTTGMLAYRSGQSNPSSLIKLFDRQGNDLGTVRTPSDYYGLAGLAFSPGDGAQVAISAFNNVSNSNDIFIYDLSRDNHRRLTLISSNENMPVWSPYGDSIIFTSNREGSYSLYRQSVSGDDSAELLVKPDKDMQPHDWSRNGRFLLYSSNNPESKSDLWTYSLEDGKISPILDSTFNEFDGCFSPDLRWIAYVTDKEGNDEIYICSLSQDSEGALSCTDSKQISRKGGTGPRWKDDSKELYFITANGEIMAVEIRGETVVDPGEPETLFQTPLTPPRIYNSFTIFDWDVRDDGNRFLIAIQPEEDSPPTFNITLNWTKLLDK